ncbi:MAG TPA: histidine kinase [Gaiellaceae bacterium]
MTCRCRDSRPDGESSPRAIAWILALAVPLFLAQRRPVVATCITSLLVAAAPHAAGQFLASPLAYGLPVVLSYWCGAHASLRPGLLAALVLTAALQIRAGFADAPNLEIAIATLPPWWCGREVRRRRQLQLVRELAEETRTLEAQEEAFVRLSVERERTRIARDLHDIVSHHLALIVIQAGAGRLAEPSRAETAFDRFATIRSAATEALTEADRLVALLHPDGSDVLRLAPLLDRARDLGARVSVTPTDFHVAPDVEAVAHYVIREAITNTMKHAPGAAPDIRIALHDRTLTITVRNDTVPASPLADTGSGLGLVNLRERLGSLGGGLDAGDDDNGGFRLTAILPLVETNARETSLPLQRSRITSSRGREQQMSALPSAGGSTGSGS